MQPETEGERLILARSVAGETADLASLPEAERRVRGAFLAALLWGEAEDAPGARVAVHRRGLTVIGARIDGEVDISDLGAIEGPAPQVSLRHCTAWGGDDGFVLIAAGASLRRLDLSDSRLSDVLALGLRTVAETMFLRATVSGGVGLTDAAIGGSLVLSGASLSAKEGDAALAADRAEIKGSVFLSPVDGHRFEARGEVRLLGATIGGQLDASGASLTAQDGGAALVADGADIKGSVFLSVADGHRFEATGAVRLPGATIGGQLDARGASLTAHQGRDALVADRAEIKLDVFLSSADGHRFEARGTVRLPGATIGGDLRLSNASLAPHPNDDNRLVLSLRKARIGDRLKVEGFTAATTGVIDLSGAHAMVLDDIASDRPQQLGWGENDGDRPPYDPRTGALRGVELRLHGFTYDTLALPEGDRHASTDLGQARLAWLRRQSAARRPQPRHYTPQPHEQLIRVLRALGYGAEADHFARDKRAWQLACRVEPWWRRLWARFVGLAFGHYYSSLRGLATLALLVGLGTAGAMGAADRGVLVRADAPRGEAEPCWRDFAWSSAEAWVKAGALAATQFAPVITVPGGPACAIREDAPAAWAWMLGRIGYALLGLLVVPMAVLTFTGVLRRD